jgi:UDP-2-acetamido-2-deoxy-ribo-hexuluronate aminotransferase
MNQQPSSKAKPGSSVSFFGREAFYQRYRTSILEAIDSALADGHFLDGAAIGTFETICARRAGRRFAAAVNSGTDALTIALRAVGVGSGDEVVVTAFSFVASASPILLARTNPVFVDISPATYLMDLQQVRRAISPTTKAILAVQLFGQCLAPGPLEAIARDHGLILVEDAAQAFGSARDGRPAGGVGRVSVFSFDPSKVVGGLTTGGMLLTDDPNVYAAAVRLRSHGWDGRGGFAQLGYNSRMSSLNAAMLADLIRHDPIRSRARRRVAHSYIDGLRDVPGLVLPTIPQRSHPNFHKFVVRTGRRDALRRHLALYGIETRVHYPIPLPNIEAMSGRFRTIGQLPHATRACQEVLSLPIHPELTDLEVQRVIDAMRSFR